MKQLSALMIAFSIFTTYAADNQTAQITGVLQGSPCDIQFSQDTVNFPAVKYDHVKELHDRANPAPYNPHFIHNASPSTRTSLITLTFTCSTTTSVMARFQDSIQAGNDIHPINNIIGNEAPYAFTIRDLSGNAVGVSTLVSRNGTILRTRNDGSEAADTFVYNYNKVSSARDANATMGPIEISAGTPIEWSLEPILYLNMHALDPTVETPATGSIDVQLLF